MGRAIPTVLKIETQSLATTLLIVSRLIGVKEYMYIPIGKWTVQELFFIKVQNTYITEKS